MIINILINSLKRLLYGNTYRFTTRKDSISLNGSSWVPIFTETTKIPLKLISIEFLTEKGIPCEYRIIIDGEKIFPFTDCSNIENGISRNFLIPINVAADSYLQVEIRSGINNKNVVIMSELAVIEVI